jgi:decaprenylphospho-beta-D-ribofuranose 2-oxidase
MSLRAVPLLLSSFDGTERASGRSVRPERRRDLVDAVGRGGPFIARGAGLSYCAASMGEGVLSVDMTRLDRVLAFDAATAEITVEPGLAVGALTELLEARGRWLPPLPGYPSISVGGCVAFDVHGKSQLHSGNFGDWVTRLTLLHPAHGERVCSHSEHRDVFELTVGGMGLTGLITSVTLKTAPLPGQALEVEPVAVRDLYEAPAMMAESAPGVDGLYSWHNLAQRRGAELGPGLVFLERFVPRGRSSRARPRLPLAARAPFGLWSRPFAALALGGYRATQRTERRRVLPLRQALFPIEGLEMYYFAFGARGFREYQLIVPTERWSHFVDALRPLLESVRFPITLASLKLFQGGARNLSFGGTGVCLALDVPAVPSVPAFFAALDELAVQHGAAVNLSKDSRLSALACRRLFPGYERFARELSAYDGARLCQSRLRERIGV